MALTRRRFTQGLAAGAAFAALPVQGNAAMGDEMTRHARALLKALGRERRKNDVLLNFRTPLLP